MPSKAAPQGEMLENDAGLTTPYREFVVRKVESDEGIKKLWPSGRVKNPKNNRSTAAQVKATTSWIFDALRKEYPSWLAQGNDEIAQQTWKVRQGDLVARTLR